MAGLCVESDAFTNLIRIGVKTVVDSLMSQVWILSSSHVLAGLDFSIIVTPPTVISWKTYGEPLDSKTDKFQNRNPVGFVFEKTETIRVLFREAGNRCVGG